MRKRRGSCFRYGSCLSKTLYEWKCFDAKTGKDLAREIAEYFIPDFANWKDHDSYQNGFERLLKDLKSPDAGAKSAAAKD